MRQSPDPSPCKGATHKFFDRVHLRLLPFRSGSGAFAAKQSLMETGNDSRCSLSPPEGSNPGRW